MLVKLDGKVIFVNSIQPSNNEGINIKATQSDSHTA